MNRAAETSPGQDELIARARAMAPALRERAADCERDRLCPERTIGEFLDAGLHRVAQPARFGGYELGWDVICALALEFTRACPSQGWVLTIYGDHAQKMGTFTDEAQIEVWGGDPAALISTSFAPVGKARPVDGGYMLSGRWSFSSGIDYATWLIAGGFIEGATSDGPPEPQFFLVPKSDVTVIDDWHVAGLAGTGSKSFTLDGGFVPVHRVLGTADADAGTGPGTKVNSAPIYRAPRRGTAGFALASMAVGTAQGVLDDFIRHTTPRVQRGTRMAEQQAMQIRVAESAAEVAAARTMLLSGSRQAMETLASGAALSLEQRATNRRDAGFATMMACRSVDRLFAAAGGGALYLDNSLQRGFRDVHAAAAHIGLGWDGTATPYGRVALGLAPLPWSC